jgi:transposase-like protein
MDIREISEKFSTDEQCLAYLQQMRWPDGIIRCPQCGSKDVTRYERPLVEPKRRSKERDEKRAQRPNRRGWFFICGEKTCRNQFTPTSGTLFHDTHLPLIVWFHAVALMLNGKKGISAKQMQRDLRIGGYKTAWYLNHRIREAMREGSIPQLGGIVEIDETYLGGRQRGHRGKLKNKDVVLGMRERGGPLRFIHTKDATAQTWKQIIDANLHSGLELVMTDESTASKIALQAKGFADRHRMVKHSAKQYVEGINYTNSIESAFSLLKRGIIGSFHRISIKHLQKYLNEFSYRFNRRNDTAAFVETMRRLAQFPPLTFDALTSEKV